MNNLLLHSLEPHRFHPRPLDRGGCSFSSSYYARPWALVRDLWREAASIVHRGFYGWDRSDTWSMDAHLARILPQMLRHLAQHDHGFPLWTYEAIGHPEYRDSFSDSAASTIRAVHSETESHAISEQATNYWRQWLRDHAQAFDDWTELMEQGWTGSLYPPDYWTTTFVAQVKELGLEEAFNAPSPLDTLSDEEKRAALQAWEAEIARLRGLMHELIERFEDLWD